METAARIEAGLPADEPSGSLLDRLAWLDAGRASSRCGRGARRRSRPPRRTLSLPGPWAHVHGAVSRRVAGGEAELGRRTGQVRG